LKYAATVRFQLKYYFGGKDSSGLAGVGVCRTASTGRKLRTRTEDPTLPSLWYRQNAYGHGKTKSSVVFPMGRLL
jgi:hypothetical protein